MALKLRGDTIINEAGKTLLELTNQVANMFNAIYPVGSIYITLNGSFNPENVFGGTWERIRGRFLLGANSTVEGLPQVSLGGTGGEQSVVLGINHIPSHTHYKPSTNVGLSSGMYPDRWALAKSSTAETVNAETSATGGGQAHNNMPPYIAVNMWQRTG